MTANLEQSPAVMPQGTFFWSTARYEQLYESGVLEDERVELLFGQIVAMSPIGDAHSTCLHNLEHYFIPRLLPKYDWWIEKPVQFVDGTMPQPDFCVINRTDVNGIRPKPTPEDIVLIVEVADSSLEKDQQLKLVAYALAGIREYWIANLPEQQLECYTGPNTKGNYKTKTIYNLNEVFEHALLGEIVVQEILPF